eukprot:8457913-Alexandrium_andersonii.AAC.1
MVIQAWRGHLHKLPTRAPAILSGVRRRLKSARVRQESSAENWQLLPYSRATRRWAVLGRRARRSAHEA